MMTLADALRRLSEIYAAERDEGLPSQYSDPPRPGERERLESAIGDALGSGAVIYDGLVWHVDAGGQLVCRTLVAPEQQLDEEGVA